MMPTQGALSIERMCQLAQVSRASFYRSLVEHHPEEEDVEVRATIQQIALVPHPVSWTVFLLNTVVPCSMIGLGSPLTAPIVSPCWGSGRAAIVDAGAIVCIVF